MPRPTTLRTFAAVLVLSGAGSAQAPAQRHGSPDGVMSLLEQDPGTVSSSAERSEPQVAATLFTLELTIPSPGLATGLAAEHSAVLRGGPKPIAVEFHAGVRPALAGQPAPAPADLSAWSVVAETGFRVVLGPRVQVRLDAANFVDGGGLVHNDPLRHALVLGTGLRMELGG